MDRVIARLASGNPHKLDELRAALPGWEIGLLSSDEFPPEEGATYYENARAKARFGRAAGESGVWVLGEDSGVEVDGLSGGPGIGSARFAGPGEDPVAKLLQHLEGIDGLGRRARYVCELVCLSPSGREFRGTGVLEGTVAREARGSEGFGYDPIFVPDGESLTIAELGNSWKRENSHRARATRALVESMRSG